MLHENSYTLMASSNKRDPFRKRGYFSLYEKSYDFSQTKYLKNLARKNVRTD